MAARDLESTARELVAENKGILAADESDGTIKKRFDSIGVESTEENRRAYRDLLFTTEGVEEYISGVILFDETIRQASADGTPFPELTAHAGWISRQPCVVSSTRGPTTLTREPTCGTGTRPRSGGTISTSRLPASRSFPRETSPSWPGSSRSSTCTSPS